MFYEIGSAQTENFVYTYLRTKETKIVKHIKNTKTKINKFDPNYDYFTKKVAKFVAKIKIFLTDTVYR